MRNRRTSIPWLLSAGLLAAAPPLPALEEAPALFGRWQLNLKESEDPQAKFRPLRPGEDPQRPNTEPTPGADDPRARRTRPPRPPGNEPPAKLEAPPGLAEFLDPTRTLTIGGDQAELTFADEKGGSLRVPTDGVERKEGALAQSARWEGQSLVIEKKNEHGAKLTTRMSLMPGGKKLEVYQRLVGKEGRAVTLRRVYDAVEASS